MRLLIPSPLASFLLGLLLGPLVAPHLKAYATLPPSPEGQPVSAAAVREFVYGQTG